MVEDLFSPARISKYDSRNVKQAYADWPRLASEGYRTKVTFGSKSFTRAYVLAMGGSASGGDIVSSWTSDREGVEMAVFKGQLPVGDMRGSIALACSASGQTEETIEMLQTAVKRHATVVSMSSGGRLLEVSEKLGIPHIRMPEVMAPRYVLPFIVFSCLSVVSAGFGVDCDAEVQDSFAQMKSEWRRIGSDDHGSNNESKMLAAHLVEKTPAIYGARITRGVGVRFKNVLNENSKKHALFDGIPDAFHNEIESWEDGRTDFLPIFLRHSRELERDKVKADRMIQILKDAGANPLEVIGAGESSLAQLMTMVYRLDMASYYLAIALGRDPFPIRFIEKLKNS